VTCHSDQDQGQPSSMRGPANDGYCIRKEGVV